MKETIQNILEQIEELVQTIYVPGELTITEQYIKLLDLFDAFITTMGQLGYQVQLDQELLGIQNAYTKQDYIQLADLLLYEIRPEFQELMTEN